MSLYIGYIFSFILSFITDNLGRKKSLVVSWSFLVLGSIILATSFNIMMASIGLFFAGFGFGAAFGICVLIISEITQQELRQKYAVGLQMSVAAMIVVVGLIFWIVPHWRYAIIFFLLIPSIVEWFLILFYLE